MNTSQLSRRRLLLALGCLGAGAASAADAELVFDATSMEDALRALGGRPADDDQIAFTLPEAVDDGALVPVTVACQLPGVREIYILVETNPNPVALRLNLPAGTEPWVSTRIKVAASGKLYAVARTDDGLYAVMKQTQVTVGGCG